jgi:pimeloyl-ACP methyl ester carboxylesterase
MSTSKNLILLLSGLLLNCQEAVEKRIPEKAQPDKQSHFISAVPRENISHTVMQLLAAGAGQSELGSLLKYDVQSYTITYYTDYKGEQVEASGLVIIPLGMPEQAALVSIQHGTTFSKDEAPSTRDGFQGIEFFASAGYVAFMPDLLGYGASASLFHPYYDAAHSASSVIDLIHATKEFLDVQKVLFNEKLFLAGYSEGGYVTLAAAKEIERNAEHGLQLTAVAAGAGGYDLTHMLTSVTSTDYYSYPSYLAFLLMAYNETNDWNKPLSYFFRDQYANALATYMNSSYSGGYINSRLTTNLPALFNTDFYSQLHSANGEPDLKSALKKNTLNGWRTELPIRLYHGTKDEIIPIENSQVTLEQFKAAGSDNVSLTSFPGGSHGNSFESMLRDFVPWFLTL